MPRCKLCKDKFEVKYRFQKFCLLKDECIKAHTQFAIESRSIKIKKDWAKKKKRIKNGLKTQSEHLKDVQIIFNKYIRLRDKDKGCISCGRDLSSKYDAGHFFSVGSTPSLRFNEDNVHGQCVYCNQHLHGNIHDYTESLPLRIGKESFDKLRLLRNSLMKYSVTELKELKELYNKKIKEL